MIKHLGIPIVTLIFLAGCAASTVTPISKNQFLLSTSAAPACGRSGAAKVAAKMAAVETIRRGYDRFIILGANSSSNVSAISTGPTYATTNTTYTGSGNTVYGSGRTEFGGGGVYYVGTNDADLNVLMLSPSDRDYNNGVDAKAMLGADWQKLVSEGVNSCTD